MNLIKEVNSNKAIERQHFEICKIDNKSIKEICSSYTGKDLGRKNAIYAMHKFVHHIKVNYNLDLIEYCEKYLNIVWPICPITGYKVNYNIKNKDYIILNNFHKTAKQTKENSQKVRDYSEKFSKDRIGENNPSFGKEPWNKGLDSNSDPRIKAVSESMKGREVSAETRIKLSEGAKKRKIHGHTGRKHSPETRAKMRIHTANLWATGAFSKKTSIEIKMREFLISLGLKVNFVENHQIDFYTLDFALIDAKIGIECDGDFFHVNPAFYPNGPQNAIQRRNFGRDRAKNKYLGDRGWIILRFWECEINSGIYKEKLICKLKELSLLDV